MTLSQRWRVLAVMIMLPLAIPMLAGGYWLWLNHWLIWWIGASALLALSWWSVNQILKKFRPEPKWLDISQTMIWTLQSEQAWQKVEAISLAERNGNPDLGTSTFYLQTLTRVMNDVAEVYYPQQKQAILEVKIPYLLKVIEIFAQELRINFTENVPGGHIFSINDLAKGHKIANKGREVYRLFRIVSAGIDPISAVIRELKIFANARLIAESSIDLKRWLIDAYIKKIGYYAIELYSGNMTLDDDAFKKPTRQTQREMDKISEREKSQNAEPFRMLVMGQTNAGKASLINAIAERQLAIADATPSPRDRQTYLLRRNDFPSTIIADCQRYEEMQTPKERQALLKRVENTDIVIVVMSAINPAIQIDKSVLDGVKRLPSAPRLVIALTHIDKLRPLREWDPPYDLVSPCSNKAQAITTAVSNVAEQLQIDIDQIVPVSLRSNQTYNCREQMIPLILHQFKLAENRRYLRSLHVHRRESMRRQLWRQMLNTGYLISRIGGYLLSKQKQAMGA